MVDENQYVIQGLDVALRVLEYLAETKDSPPGPSKIARQLGISRARAFRILKTLEGRHFVRPARQAKGYRLGFKCLTLGERVREQIDVRREAEPVLLDLARNTGDTALLVVLDGDMAVDVASYPGDHLFQASVRIGERHPLHIGASNRVLLAFMPERERERIIRGMELTRYTDKTISDRDELRRFLEQIRFQGYAEDEESFEIGVFAVGAPVRDHTGRVVAGITVTTPQARYGPQRRWELIELVVDAADHISAQLGSVDEETR